MGRKEWKEISDKRYYKVMALMAMSDIQIDPKDVQELDAMTAALNYIDSEEDKQLQQWKEVAGKLHDSISEYMEGEEDINESDIRIQSALEEYEALTKQ